MTYSNHRSELKWQLLIDGFSDEDVDMFNNLDTSNVVFDEEYYKKRDKIIRRETNKPKIRALKLVSTRIAVAVLVILSVAFIALMSISAVRNAVWNVIVEWYEEYVEVKRDDGTGNKNSTLERIESVNKPTVLPEGIEEEKIIESFNIVIYEYYSGDDYVGTFTQALINKSSTLKVDSEEIASYTLNYLGRNILVFEDEDGKISMCWTDLYYEYLIAGNDLDFMLKLIDGIK